MNTVLLGIWFFTNIIYQGQTLPRPNPDLIMTINFSETENTIRYHRNNETGFCERKATYEFKDGNLNQTVTWVNPENMPACAEDTDMQMGQVTTSKLEASPEQLLLHMSMGGESLVYIWKRQLNP